MRPVLKPSIVQYNSEDYDVLRRYLFQHIGAYCSYCEQPISNDSAVEHKVPKSEKKGFPQYGVQWHNLLLSCESCNSVKGAKPNKFDVAELSSYSNDAERYRAVLGLWVWPDRVDGASAPSVDQTYRLFRPFRAPRTQVELKQDGLLAARTWTTKEPPDWAKESQTMTWIGLNDDFIGNDQNLRARALKTIQELNLNRYDGSDQKYNDRRVQNREAAHTAAMGAMASLQDVWRKEPSSADRGRVHTLLIQAVREAAVSTGFWSVWFWVFRSALDHPAEGTFWHDVSKEERYRVLRYALLHFIPWERNNQETVLIFPGTDVTRLNLASWV